MNSKFFRKMAIRNIRSNKQLYVPYLLASIAVVAMFYLMVSLLTNEFVRERSSILPTLFGMGSIVIGVFSFIFILYTNSFLIKRRKKEIGLYGILGLEKKHVVNVLLYETTFTSLFSVTAGLITGQVFGRLFFMLLNYMLRLPGSMEYSSSLEAALVTAGLFFVIFLLAFLYNISQVTFSNPIKLLKGTNEGEKEPKGSIILFILSLLFLAGGYGMSLTIEDPLSALTNFFIAVVFVMIGTYLLFIAGSIFILKALKKNKRFYYRPGPFIAISGMLYRMKQNAVGLANICILATMVIIAVSTTVTLFVGTEETLENRFPFENNLTLYGGDKSIEEMNTAFSRLQDQVRQETEEMGLELTEMDSYRHQSLFGELQGNRFVVKDSNAGEGLPLFLEVVPLEDYNQLTGNSITLEENEALYSHSEGNYKETELLIGDQHYHLKETEGILGEAESQLTESMLLVVPSLFDIESISNALKTSFPESNIGDLFATIGWNTTGTTEEKKMYADYIGEEIPAMSDSLYESRVNNREEWYSINGGFLFLGIFLGLLFTIGTVLITYFKQVSEGFDDRDKFQIMQKVGLDEQMIEQSSRVQIVWMFMLPLLVASIHTAFAYPIVQKMLIIFGITSHTLLVLSIAGVVAAFSIVYWLIYRITSKVYYSIVK